MNILHRAVLASYDRPRAVIFACVVLTLLAVVASLGIRVDTDPENMLSATQPDRKEREDDAREDHDPRTVVGGEYGAVKDVHGASAGSATRRVRGISGASTASTQHEASHAARVRRYSTKGLGGGD